MGTQRLEYKRNSNNLILLNIAKPTKTKNILNGKIFATQAYN